MSEIVPGLLSCFKGVRVLSFCEENAALLTDTELTALISSSSSASNLAEELFVNNLRPVQVNEPSSGESLGLCCNDMSVVS